MNAGETQKLLLDALAVHGDDDTPIDEWLTKEGLDEETFGRWIMAFGVDMQNSDEPIRPQDIVVAIGMGFGLGWEARKLKEAKDAENPDSVPA